jgi:hypothetical protein
MIAFKYKQLIRTVPELLKGNKPIPQTTCDKRWEQTLLILNAVTPLLYFVYYAKLKEQNTEVGSFYLSLSIFTASFLNLLWCTSGVIVVLSVIRIRDYFKRKNSAEYLDTKMMLKHAFAFGIFLFLTIASTVAAFIASLEPS